MQPERDLLSKLVAKMCGSTNAECPILAILIRRHDAKEHLVREFQFLPNCISVPWCPNIAVYPMRKVLGVVDARSANDSVSPFRVHEHTVESQERLLQRIGESTVRSSRIDWCVNPRFDEFICPHLAVPV